MNALDHPVVQAILRGGGGSEHDRMKIAALGWLIGKGYSVVDFETGGFDVLGIHRNRSLTDGRIVIDAKASKSDLYGHFKKESVARCDIDGRFSEHGSLHYIIAKKGLIPPDAVHAPWGLLEVLERSEVTVSKDAETRAYVGDTDTCLFDIASRTTALLGGLLANPKLAEEIGKVASETFLNKKEAQAAIESMKDRLVRYCMTFETLYGYNPLSRKYLEKIQ